MRVVLPAPPGPETQKALVGGSGFSREKRRSRWRVWPMKMGAILATWDIVGFITLAYVRDCRLNDKKFHIDLRT